MGIAGKWRGIVGLVGIPVFVVVWATSVWCQAKAAPNPNAGDSAQTHLGKGYEALKGENYDLAVTEFQAALSLDPSLVLRARFPMAVALFEARKFPEARREFELVRRETGDHPNVAYYLGRIAIEEGNYDRAIRNLSQAAAIPPFPDTAYYLGFAYYKKGDLTSAEKWLREAAKASPMDSRVQYQLGVVHRKAGREEEARKALARSNELRKGEDNRSRLEMGCSEKLSQGQKEEARAICEQLADLNDAQKLTSLGTIYGQHGDFEDALKPLQRAAELQPQSPQMQYNLAYTYYQMNQFEAARGPLESALKRWPDLFPLNSLYGAVLLKLGEEAAGYQALRHAHELNPDDAGTVDLLYATALELAQKDREAKKYQEALGYLGEAVKLRPREAEPHRRMAEIYNLTARTTEAAAEEAAAVRLTKSSPQ